MLGLHKKKRAYQIFIEYYLSDEFTGILDKKITKQVTTTAINDAVAAKIPPWVSSSPELSIAAYCITVGYLEEIKEVEYFTQIIPTYRVITNPKLYEGLDELPIDERFPKFLTRFKEENKVLFAEKRHTSYFAPSTYKPVFRLPSWVAYREVARERYLLFQKKQELSIEVISDPTPVSTKPEIVEIVTEKNEPIIVEDDETHSSIPGEESEDSFDEFADYDEDERNLLLTPPASSEDIKKRVLKLISPIVADAEKTPDLEIKLGEANLEIQAEVTPSSIIITAEADLESVEGEVNEDGSTSVTHEKDTIDAVVEIPFKNEEPILAEAIIQKEEIFVQTSSEGVEITTKKDEILTVDVKVPDDSSLGEALKDMVVSQSGSIESSPLIEMIWEDEKNEPTKKFDQTIGDILPIDSPLPISHEPIQAIDYHPPVSPNIADAIRRDFENVELIGGAKEKTEINVGEEGGGSSLHKLSETIEKTLKEFFVEFRSPQYEFPTPQKSSIPLNTIKFEIFGYMNLYFDAQSNNTFTPWYRDCRPIKSEGLLTMLTSLFDALTPELSPFIEFEKTSDTLKDFCTKERSTDVICGYISKVLSESLKCSFPVLGDIDDYKSSVIPIFSAAIENPEKSIDAAAKITWLMIAEIVNQRLELKSLSESLLKLRNSLIDAEIQFQVSSIMSGKSDFTKLEWISSFGTIINIVSSHFSILFQELIYSRYPEDSVHQGYKDYERDIQSFASIRTKKASIVPDEKAPELFVLPLSHEDYDASRFIKSRMAPNLLFHNYASRASPFQTSDTTIEYDHSGNNWWPLLSPDEAKKEKEKIRENEEEEERKRREEEERKRRGEDEERKRREEEEARKKEEEEEEKKKKEEEEKAKVRVKQEEEKEKIRVKQKEDKRKKEEEEKNRKEEEEKRKKEEEEKEKIRVKQEEDKDKKEEEERKRKEEEEKIKKREEDEKRKEDEEKEGKRKEINDDILKIKETIKDHDSAIRNAEKRVAEATEKMKDGEAEDVKIKNEEIVLAKIGRLFLRLKRYVEKINEEETSSSRSEDKIAKLKVDMNPYQEELDKLKKQIGIEGKISIDKKGGVKDRQAALERRKTEVLQETAKNRAEIKKSHEEIINLRKGKTTNEERLEALKRDLQKIG